jgi:hypothetical protein
VYRLAYNGDIAAGQLAVFQGASEVPIPHHFYPPAIRFFPREYKNGAGRKNSQLAAAQRVALKMGRLIICETVH